MALCIFDRFDKEHIVIFAVEQAGMLKEISHSKGYDTEFGDSPFQRIYQNNLFGGNAL